MKYIKSFKLNEIILSNHNHYIGQKFWNNDYGDFIENYKGFDVYYNEFSDHKYTFMKNNVPIGLCFLEKLKFVYQVMSVEVKEDFRGNGYSFVMYEYLINRLGRLMSDRLQTPYIKNTWKKLFKSGRYNLYRIYNRRPPRDVGSSIKKDSNFLFSVGNSLFVKSKDILTDEDFENVYNGSKDFLILIEKK